MPLACTVYTACSLKSACLSLHADAELQCVHTDYMEGVSV